MSEDNLGDKLADKLRLGGRIGDNSALQDSGAPGLSEDNLGDKLADKLRLGGPDWRQFCVTGFRAPGLSEDNLGDKSDKLGDNLVPEARIGDNYRIAGPRDCPRTIWATNLRLGGRIGDNSALQDSGAPGLSEDNLGDKLADKLGDNLGPEARIGDNSALQDSGAPGLSEDNLGDKLADKLGDNLGPEARIGDNSALQDSGAPGLSEDNLGDKLADKLRPGGRIGDNSALQDFGPREDNLVFRSYACEMYMYLPQKYPHYDVEYFYGVYICICS